MADQQQPLDQENKNDHMVISDDPSHPANLIPSLCAKFWTLGWVTGTGGGCSIRDDDLVYLAPSGVQKELIKPAHIYILSLSSLASQSTPSLLNNNTYLRYPPSLKPSQCTPLFLAAFTRRNAKCCIHTHSQWAVLVTLLLETSAMIHGSSGGGKWAEGKGTVFEINNIEQIKGFSLPTTNLQHPANGGTKKALGYHDTLRIPVIENTAHEEDLTEFLEEAMEAFPDAYAVLVRRHGVYVWGDSVERAKGMCESLDYLFQLAVEMKKLGIPWVSHVEPTVPTKRR